MKTIRQNIGDKHPAWTTINGTIDPIFTQVIVKNNEGEIIAQFYGKDAKLNAGIFQRALSA